MRRERRKCRERGSEGREEKVREEGEVEER